ncbi:MraY family glycosyltransferase [Aquirufa rosea]|uniref:Undecaprenyl/decaprenyl-phosphate alpha-N-acetylglucosaminyl 1-phosphate transferase n=1 Tax=Aquirufa rosea TaxID=2509241 RepID=A0A4Q1C200_9BACT|nr:MraY family glycosyltransferase [Aquirufa rosea]RXK52244.1 undecaprenyl/decaprenyl-phosphate alpha-N-acetylglucosaminyl 1-phosphate transferase [Aquirufa rosea]
MNEYIQLLNNKEFQIIVSFLVSLVVTVTAIPVIINISKLKDLMAEIELRSSHEELTPTLGGVAIFAATLISYFIWDNPNEGHEIHLAVAALIILFFLGIKDDILILSPKKKLFIQIAAALLLITFGDLRISTFFGLFNIHQIPYIVSTVFTLFIIIAIINAINLLDGIDGLAGSVGFVSSVIFAFLFYQLNLFALSTLALSLAGSLVGFLRFNWSTKNKIFMGDTGSMILGFLLAFFAVKYIVYNSSYVYDPRLEKDAPILTIIILLLPLFDTLRMFIIRISTGVSPFKGDRKHLHHILIDNGFSHFWATMILIAFNLLVLFIYMMIRHGYSNHAVLLGLLITFLIYCYVSYLLSKNIDVNTVDRLKYTKIDKLKRLQLVDEKKNTNLTGNQQAISE